MTWSRLPIVTFYLKKAAAPSCHRRIFWCSGSSGWQRGKQSPRSGWSAVAWKPSAACSTGCCSCRACACSFGHPPSLWLCPPWHRRLPLDPSASWPRSCNNQFLRLMTHHTDLILAGFCVRAEQVEECWCCLSTADPQAYMLV